LRSAVKSISPAAVLVARFLSHGSVCFQKRPFQAKGILAARCCDEFDARAARLQFDANVLCLSGELLGENELRRIVDVWLSSDFEGYERANRLIRKIRAIEQGQDPQQVTDTGG